MSYRKFSSIFLFIIFIFAAANFSIWHLWTQKILTRDDHFITGDLTRLGYVSHLIQPRTNEIDLPKQHFSKLDTTQSYELLTIGDSFSQGHSGGKNRYYQDYIASTLNWNVLSLEQFPQTTNYIETIMALSNSGFLEKYKIKYILLESTQRRVVERFSKTEDYHLNIPLSEIENFYTKQEEHSFALPPLSPINNGNFKFLGYSLLYHFSDRAFFSDVHQVKLDRPLFSIGSGKELLYYHKDIPPIKNHTPSSITEVNDHLNRLAHALRAKGITLIFMPAVNKYDLYSDFIIKNHSPKDPFFDILRTLPKAYIFVDTKAILWEKINEGEKDIFYCDDTHWSYKASEAISQYLFHEIPKYLK